MSLAPGTRLGTYEITAPLGAGGMGEVYRARDTKLGRDVAVKVLPERLAASSDALHRFEREARAVAALSHPNVLSIFDYGVSGETAFAVMELLEGQSLRMLIHQGVPARRALEIGHDIALGLAAAHDKGIVHRDLKPENVFVTEDGRVKILDFGLAKSSTIPSATDATSRPTEERATEPGTILGTVGYMSPEQVRAQPVDHRTDLFALGTILYEMLAGRRAFTGGSSADILSAILREEPPPVDTATRGLSPAVELLVRRCLEKSPAQRFQSAADVAFALEALGQTQTASSGPAPAPAIPAALPRRGTLIAVAAAAASLALGLFAGRTFLAPRPGPPPPAVRFTIPPERGTAHTGMMAFSPDGAQLAYVATSEDGNDRLFLRVLSSLQARALAATEGASFPFFSPDGRRVGFFAQEKLKTIDLSSGSVQTLCAAANARGGTWSPEGVILFAPRAGGEISRVPETGGESRAVISAARGPSPTSFRWPQFLPGGHAFTYMAFIGVEPAVRVASIDGGEPRLLTRADSGAFLSGRSLTYALGGRLVRQPFDTRTQAVVGSPQPVADDVYWDVFATGYVGFTESQSGALAYLGGGANASQLVWYDRSGQRQGTVGPPGAYFEPALSPDERSLAISRGNPENGYGESWLVDLERGGLGRLSPGQGVQAVTPLFSPDGKRVAYSTFPLGKVFTRDVSGAAEPRLLFECGMFCVLEDWAPDDSIFYVTLDLATLGFRGFVRPPGGGASRPLGGTTSIVHARLSPDGHWLAYVTDESGIQELFVRSYPEPNQRFTISSGGASEPFWRADGRELFYATPDRKIMSVPITLSPRFEPGKPHVLFQTRVLPEIEARNHYVAARDGQRFLVNERRAEDAARPIVVVLNAIPGEPR